jgi:branched-chain amino acid transport system ATP-binding protein
VRRRGRNARPRARHWDRCLPPDEPFEEIVPALSEKFPDVLASPNGKGLTVSMSQSDLNPSHTLFDAEFVIERGAYSST